jgi:hypothetical protein
MDMSDQDRSDPSITALSVSAGAVAGAVATSGTAVTAAGAGAAGFTGYIAGVSLLAAHAGCEAAAAVGLGTVAAGPIVGGFIGFTLYNVVKCVMQRRKKSGRAAAVRAPGVSGAVPRDPGPPPAV